MSKTTLRINGATHVIEADPSTPLVYVLRNQLDLTGTKLGCGLEQCGACAVLVDGARTLTCDRAMSEFEGCDIVTIEGLARNAVGSAVQSAFVEEGAAQCGYCTPGIVIAATALLNRDPTPNDREIKEALNDHLCRCGSHGRVLYAIHRLIKEGVSDGV